LVGQVEVGQEVLVVDVFVGVFSVAVVFGNFEDFFVVHYFEIAECFD